MDFESNFENSAMNHDDKLYIITRRDLSPGYQAAQSCHALRAFAADWPEIDRQWYEISNYLVLLSVEDETTLRELFTRAKEIGIKCSWFKEPDLDNQITAITLEPGDKSSKFCARLPLTLSELCRTPSAKSLMS